MKIIKVESCIECKYHIKSQMTVGLIYCQHEDNQYDVDTAGNPVIPDFPNMPDWCPLDDDLTPALDILQGYLDNDCWVQQYSNINELPDYYHLMNQDSEVVMSGKTIMELLKNISKVL